MALSLGIEQRTQPMSQDQIRILGLSTIESQLPLHYDNGHVLEQFEGQCRICKVHIKPGNLHGSISQPYKSVAIIEAIGLCHLCKIAVPFFMRIRDDGTTDWRDADGNWVQGLAENGGATKKWERALQKLLVLSSILLLAYIASQVMRQ